MGRTLWGVLWGVWGEPSVWEVNVMSGADVMDRQQSESPEIAALHQAAEALEQSSPQEILRWAVDRYAPHISLACSFGMQSVVVIDMLHDMGLLSDVEVFYLDTGVLFPETHQTRLKVSERYGIQPVRVAPRLSIAEQAVEHGEKLWERQPDACCYMRKVEPARQYLTGKRAWITGLRRGHSRTRSELPVVGWDAANDMAKINPMALLDEDTLWGYIKANKVPYNPLYDQGYPSIGCTPEQCTATVGIGGDQRAGRWAGRGKTECGLHVDGKSVKSLDSSNL